MSTVWRARATNSWMRTGRASEWPRQTLRLASRRPGVSGQMAAQVPPRQSASLLQDGSEEDRAMLERHGAALKFLAKLESIEWITGDAPAPWAAAAIERRSMFSSIMVVVSVRADRC